MNLPECPYLDAPRLDFCSRVARIQQLETATRYCLGHFEHCPRYWAQRAQETSETAPKPHAPTPTRQPA